MNKMMELNPEQKDSTVEITSRKAEKVQPTFLTEVRQVLGAAAIRLQELTSRIRGKDVS